jgi:tRNA(adenine34) deaminase
MCAGALYWSQIDKVVFGARDENRGASQHEKSLYHPTTLVTNGILQDECSQLVKAFFKSRRR